VVTIQGSLVADTTSDLLATILDPLGQGDWLARITWLLSQAFVLDGPLSPMKCSMQPKEYYRRTAKGSSSLKRQILTASQLPSNYIYPSWSGRQSLARITRLLRFAKIDFDESAFGRLLVCANRWVGY
jgi:hypothetical protein